MSQDNDCRTITEARLRDVLRDELTPIRDTQEEINRKIAQWEFGAAIFRWFIVGTVGAVTVLAGAFEWAKTHLK